LVDSYTFVLLVHNESLFIKKNNSTLVVQKKS